MEKLRKPQLKSLLICDCIIDDVVTRKKTLVGIFERIMATHFPTYHGNMGVFFQLTGAEGEYKFSMELADLEKNSVMGVAELPPAQIKSAAYASNFALMFQGLHFEHPGTYEFRLWCNGEIIGQQPLYVVHVKPKSRSGDSGNVN